MWGILVGFERYPPIRVVMVVSLEQVRYIKQNGTAPHWGETPRQRNEENKIQKLRVISLVFDISNIPTLDRTSETIGIGKDLRMYSVGECWRMCVVSCVVYKRV